MSLRKHYLDFRVTNYGLIKSDDVLIWKGGTFWQNIFLLSDKMSVSLQDVLLLLTACKSGFCS